MAEQNVPGRRTACLDRWLGADTHAGLWHDRFPPVLRPKSIPEAGDKRDHELQRAAKHLEQVTDRSVSEGYARAYGDRVTTLHAHRGDIEGAVSALFEATVRGRMIVGLGGGAVLEHQITLEHTWGVPIIPGSGLKGLASATAHRYGGDRWRRAETDSTGGEDHQSLFGDTTHAGLVTFHDAWWKPESSTLPLDLDVMTVHHRDYYGGKDEPPADTDEPNPVSFITARGTYLIALTGPEAWVQCAAEWLQLGLEREGVGAKTRAGYGRMHFDLAARLVSPQQRARQDLEEVLRTAAFTGDGVLSVLAAAKQARDSGVDEGDVLERVRRYASRDANSFLRGWAKDPGRSDAERAAIEAFKLIPPRDEPTAQEWVPVRVYAKPDKKGRVEIHTEAAGQKVDPRKVKDVKCDDGSIDAIKAAPNTHFDAEAVLEKGCRLTALRGAKKGA